MSHRYVARADASYRPANECRVVGRSGIDVLEADASCHPTGLLDAAGRPLFRVSVRQPIGFVHFGSDE